MARTSEDKINAIGGQRPIIEALLYKESPYRHLLGIIFTWAWTPQGSQYWSDLHQKYQRGEELPQEALDYFRWLLRDDPIDEGETGDESETGIEEQSPESLKISLDILTKV